MAERETVTTEGSTHAVETRQPDVAFEAGVSGAEALRTEVRDILLEIGKRAIDQGNAVAIALLIQDIGRDLSHYDDSDRSIRRTGYNAFARYYDQTKATKIESE